MLNKLRSKFILINMCIVLVMLLVIFGLVFHITAQNLNGQAMHMLHTLAGSASKPTAMFEKQDISLPYILIKISGRGEILASGVTGYDLNDESFLQELIQTVYAQNRTTGELYRFSLRYYRFSAVGNDYIAIVDISSHKDTLGALMATSLGIGVVSVAAFFVISILLARWAVKPVEEAWKQQKQFISDASHELKTPITVIMSNSELLQLSQCDEESRLRYSENIQVMAQQMGKLTEGLLELARVDNGQVKKSFAQLDISCLVSDAVLPFEPVFYERGLMLESDIDCGILMTGNEQYLRQVVDILLDNALKYSAPGIVSLSLKRSARNQCLLSVANPGDPIPQEELDKIFERFYRSDKARSRTGSFGLGLAIAKSTVQEHGGRIWAQCNPTGNCFCVVLPIK